MKKIEVGDVITIGCSAPRIFDYKYRCSEDYLIMNINTEEGTATAIWADWWGNRIRYTSLKLSDIREKKVMPEHWHEAGNVKPTEYTIDISKQVVTKYKLKNDFLEYKKGDVFVVKDCYLSSYYNSGNSGGCRYGENYTTLEHDGKEIETSRGEYNFSSVIGALVHNNKEYFETVS